MAANTKIKKFTPAPEQAPKAKVELPPQVLDEADKFAVGQVVNLKQTGNATRYVAVLEHDRYLIVDTKEGKATFDAIPNEKGQHFSGSKDIWIEA